MPPAALLEAAAAGRLPGWANVSAPRLAHMERVSALMGSWSVALGLDEAECRRWRAAGLLHDVLREVAPAELREQVPDELKDVAGKLLHGPAAATRLRAEGVTDEPLLRAICYHTIGHADLDALGRALFIADYIEPGRNYDPQGLAVLRARMPHAHDSVLRAVLRARVTRLLGDDRAMRPETVGFWNAVCSRARAS